MSKIDFAVLSMFLFSDLLLPAITPVERQEIFMIQLESKLDSLRILRDQRVNQSAVLATQIQQNKSRELQSYSEHRRLEKQLQEAQSVDQQIKITEQKIFHLNKIYQDSLRSLIRYLQSAMDANMALAEKTNSEQERNKYLQEANQILIQKSRWENRLSPIQPSGITDIQINLNPWDNVASMHLKRDALLDQEELINLEIKRLNTKIIDLQKESNLRKKMAEMSSDINLFSENEETMDRVAGNEFAAEQGKAYFDETRNGPENAIAITNQRDGTVLSYPYTMQQVVRDYQNNTLNLEDRIKLLTSYKEQLISRADSLEKRAQWFDRQAIKKSENEKQGIKTGNQ